ncbi:hypothetical protein [Streptomyces albidoflavus]|uniref:hypothetical protein n=1 Tax=Streptomyces albidoflavus TaxID=1886 RepID=UPI002D1E3A40|nr:hypothetical protein [Streptomyces albidoflavus]
MRPPQSLGCAYAEQDAWRLSEAAHQRGQAVDRGGDDEHAAPSEQVRRSSAQ